MITTTTTCVLGCNAPAKSTMGILNRDLQVCANYEIRHASVQGTCDFCQGTAWFTKEYDQFGIGNWLEGVDGDGSDHLAVWCRDCGPKHRN